MVTNVAKLEGTDEHTVELQDMVKMLLSLKARMNTLLSFQT